MQTDMCECSFVRCYYFVPSSSADEGDPKIMQKTEDEKEKEMKKKYLEMCA